MADWLADTLAWYIYFLNIVKILFYFYIHCEFLQLSSYSFAPCTPFAFTGYALCANQMRSTCVQLVPPQTANCPNEHMLATTCVCVPWPPLQLAFIMPVDNFRPHIWTMRICREFYALLLPFLCARMCVCAQSVCVWEECGMIFGFCLPAPACWPCAAQSLCEILIEFLHFIMRIWQKRAKRKRAPERENEKERVEDGECRGAKGAAAAQTNFTVVNNFDSRVAPLCPVPRCTRLQATLIRHVGPSKSVIHSHTLSLLTTTFRLWFAVDPVMHMHSLHSSVRPVAHSLCNLFNFLCCTA